MGRLRTDFENLKDGETIVLIPTEDNPLDKKPFTAVYDKGYFYSLNSPNDGPDYYLGDVLKFNEGFYL